jgi:hypothetical protein
MGVLLFLPGVRDPEREPADATVGLPTFGERDVL